MSKIVGSDKVAAKKAPAEHHTIAAVYAKQHDLAFGDPHKAMDETVKETGKSEQEIKASWDKKMAEDAPHPHHSAICASLNAQLLACGDMKKAVKRAAEDHEIDHGTVEKCAEHMKHSNKMPQAKAAQESPMPVESAEAPKPEEKAAEAPAPAAEKAAEAPAEEKAAEESKGPPPEIQEKIDEAAKTAARKLSALTLKDVKDAMWDAEMHEQGEGAELSGPAKVLFDAGTEDNMSLALETLRGAGFEVGDLEAKAAKYKSNKKAQADEAEAKKAAEDKEKEEKAAQAAPAAAPVAGPIEVAQAADAPSDKSLGDMGVKASEDESEKEAAKVASQFPFAKYYQDVTAKRVASGEVHVMRAGKLMFTVPAARKIASKEALSVVASVGIVAAMKKLSMNKTADLGVAEGAITDVKGGRALPPQSIQDGAVSNAKEKPAASPASTTAQGATTDMKEKVDTKSISNSDVRDGASTDTKAGLAASADSAVSQGESSNAKEKHAPKNVGSDNILAQRQVDFLTKGLDPKSAALVRARLAKIAAEPADEKEKEAALKSAQDEKEKAEKKAADEKEIEKKAVILAGVKIAKFDRALRLIARRFALNLEPCHLKYNLGEVLSTRHEASGFEGMDSDLVCDLVMRGLPLHASLEHIDHMTKRAHELAAMPEDSLKAIEADAENLDPVHPQAQAESAGELEAKSAQLRRRASSGNMPVLRTAAEAVIEIPTKQSLLRQALGGGILSTKYSGRH